MPTLNWIGKEKVINHHQDVPYKILEPQYGFADGVQQSEPNDSGNKIIHGDNLEALKSLLPEYEGKIKCIYIDPPYNTNASEILYKNGFRKSSWISLVENRLRLGLEFLCDDGMHVFTIDDFELDKSLLLLHELFDRQNHLATVPIRNNPQGRSTVAGFSVNHEYAVFHRKSSSSSIGRLSRSETQDARNDEIDELGRRYLWENFRKTGTDSARTDRPKQYYPIWLDESGQISIPELVWNESNTSWQSTNAPQGVTVLWPNDQSGVHRVWKWGLDRFKREISYIKVERVRDVIMSTKKESFRVHGGMIQTMPRVPTEQMFSLGCLETNVIFYFLSRIKQLQTV